LGIDRKPNRVYTVFVNERLRSEEWKCVECGFIVWRPTVIAEADKDRLEFRHFIAEHYSRRYDVMIYCRGRLARTGNKADGFVDTSVSPYGLNYSSPTIKDRQENL